MYGSRKFRKRQERNINYKHTLNIRTINDYQTKRTILGYTNHFLISAANLLAFLLLLLRTLRTISKFLKASKLLVKPPIIHKNMNVKEIAMPIEAQKLFLFNSPEMPWTESIPK